MSVPRKWEQRRVAAAVKMFDAIDGWFSLEDEGSVIGRQKTPMFLRSQFRWVVSSAQPGSTLSGVNTSIYIYILCMFYA
ncbi:hypothetical protein AGABI1DRAFT_116725, partial [Agaricus bisporus var. burnettii JB137-S8]